MSEQQSQNSFEDDLQDILKSPIMRFIFGALGIVGIYFLGGGLIQAYYLYFSPVQPPGFLPIQFNIVAAQANKPVLWTELQQSPFRGFMETIMFIVFGSAFLIGAGEFFSGGKLGLFRKLYGKNL